MCFLYCLAEYKFFKPTIGSVGNNKSLENMLNLLTHLSDSMLDLSSTIGYNLNILNRLEFREREKVKMIVG
jgi:hypothetical protein